MDATERAFQAAQAAEAPAVAATPTAPLDAAPKKPAYPSPKKYEGNRFAVMVNDNVDALNHPPADAKPGSIMAAPATTTMLGECALATGEALGFTADNADVPIHPGWLLAMAAATTATVIGFNAMRAKREGAPPAQREARRGELDALV